jgi:hypothetical protein
MGNFASICSLFHCKRNKARASSRIQGAMVVTLLLIYSRLKLFYKLIWEIASNTSVAIQLPTVGQLITSKQLCRGAYINKQRHARSRSLEYDISSTTHPSLNQSRTSCMNPPCRTSFINSHQREWGQFPDQLVIFKC